MRWSTVINTVERFGDPFRRRVTTASLGGSYAAAHPDWSPHDIDLSQAGIEAAVVQQGRLGNCWFLAALVAAQRSDPALLARNATGLGSPAGATGWRVRLFRRGAWHDVGVRPEQISLGGAKAASPRGRRRAVPGFMTVYEQAMINAVRGRPSLVWADTPAAGIALVTGRRADESVLGGQPSFEQFRAALDAGRPVAVMTHPLRPAGPRAAELSPAHVYAVTGHDAAARELILTNPNGPGARSPLEVRVDPDAPRFARDIIMTGIGR